MRLAAIALLVGLPVAGAHATLAARPPTAGQIERQVLAAVRTSRAQVRLLAFDLRAKRFRLVVAVGDPPAYLEHRYERVVEAVFPRLERRLFRFTYLSVVDSRSWRRVFSFSDVPGITSTYVTAWRIDPRLLDCARALELPDYEVDSDRSAPRCPAR